MLPGARVVDRLIASRSSAGDMSQLERFRQFSASGLTELSRRLHDDAMASLKLIGEHGVPAVRA